MNVGISTHGKSCSMWKVITKYFLFCMDLAIADIKFMHSLMSGNTQVSDKDEKLEMMQN